MPNKPHAFRIDNELVDKARKAGINFVEVFNTALVKALKHQKRCPYCNQTIKQRK